MSFNTSSGSRGVSQPNVFRSFLKLFNKYSAGRIRKTGKFGELPALVLTTVGSKSGLERKTPLAYFPSDDGGWLIVASYAGAAKNPNWYYNLAAQLDRVSIEFGGRFADYQEKTDRELPIIRLKSR